MVSITVSVPNDVRKLMKKFPEVNWSGLVRECIKSKAEKLALKKELLEKLSKEKDFNEWVVSLIREGRKTKR